MIEFVPIKRTFEENPEFISNPDCADSLQMSVDYYKIIGFTPPWLCYYVRLEGELVGVAAFKGKPVNNRVEIAYGTFPRFRQHGIGTEICQQLVILALKMDPDLIITARTLPEYNYSTRILQKNGFRFTGVVWDNEDGNVWEWVFER